MKNLQGRSGGDFKLLAHLTQTKKFNHKLSALRIAPHVEPSVCCGSILEFPGGFPGLESKCRCPVIAERTIDTSHFSQHVIYMYRSSSTNNAIPEEYRKTAEDLFPPGGFPPGKGPTIEAVAAFAEILGISADYKKLLTCRKYDKDFHVFLSHFQNNLDLLIQKTWVEKADEARKEKLQDRVPGFVDAIEQEDYSAALTEFSIILEELAYLFFGAQSSKADFTEYTLRIDTQMGLFWWYGGQIGCFHSQKNGTRLGVPDVDKEVFRALLMIGLCYLTNF
jgi:hypothetical protein